MRQGLEPCSYPSVGSQEVLLAVMTSAFKSQPLHVLATLQLLHEVATWSK